MTVIQPVKPAMTLGQHLDAVLTAAGHDVTIAKTDVWTWLKAEWHNLVTAASTAYLALHTLGVIKL
jgi:hypothetical protein